MSDREPMLESTGSADSRLRAGLRTMFGDELSGAGLRTMFGDELSGAGLRTMFGDELSGNEHRKAPPTPKLLPRYRAKHRECVPGRWGVCETCGQVV